MSYNKIDELAEDIKGQLPEHAQQIFLAAFNAAESDGLSELTFPVKSRKADSQRSWETAQHIQYSN
jgi:cation transport regulator ChaB